MTGVQTCALPISSLACGRGQGKLRNELQFSERERRESERRGGSEEMAAVHCVLRERRNGNTDRSSTRRRRDSMIRRRAGHVGNNALPVPDHLLLPGSSASLRLRV